MNEGRKEGRKEGGNEWSWRISGLVLTGDN